MKHFVVVLEIVCLFFFVACGQGDKNEQTTKIESKGTVEVVKEKTGESIEVVKEKIEGVAEETKEKTGEVIETVKENAELSEKQEGLQHRDIHKVAPHETMYEIAAKRGIKVKELIAANPQVVNPNLIYPSQILKLPPR